MRALRGVESLRRRLPRSAACKDEELCRAVRLTLRGLPLAVRATIQGSGDYVCGGLESRGRSKNKATRSTARRDPGSKVGPMDPHRGLQDGKRSSQAKEPEPRASAISAAVIDEVPCDAPRHAGEVLDRAPELTGEKRVGGDAPVSREELLELSSRDAP